MRNSREAYKEKRFNSNYTLIKRIFFFFLIQPSGATAGDDQCRVLSHHTVTQTFVYLSRLALVSCPRMGSQRPLSCRPPLNESP